MDIEAALRLADALIFAQTGRHLDDLQSAIFREAWQGKSFTDIAETCHCNESYAKDVGSKLWKVLSSALGETVGKRNFKAALERRWKAEQSGLISSSQASVAVKIQPSATEPNFVGRQSAFADFDAFISQGAKVILIYAKGGVGKTALTRRYLRQQFDSYIEFPIAKETQNITSVESLLEERLRQLGEEPGREFGVSLERLKQKLRAERIGILIDNLEPALDGSGKFIEEHRRYVELLRVLANPEVQSVTLITSRECLRESAIAVRHYLLEGLDITAWQEFFNSRNIETDLSSGEEETSIFTAMHKAFGGNAKAMEILSSAILQDYNGDLEEYWQANQEDLLIERDLEDLVTCQFNRLQQLDPDAYKLLCRMGCYRYQDVPTVPIDGLRCLLWDVEETKQRRVVKSLKDRSLIEFCNQEYFLHPVIRAEAISRLRNSEDWETSNRQAAKFWTDNIKTVETVEDALRALEAYHHYIEISDFEQAGNSIIKRRDFKWGKEEYLGRSFYRLGLLEKMIFSINFILHKVKSEYLLSNLYNTQGDLHWLKGEINESINFNKSSGLFALNYINSHQPLDKNDKQKPELIKAKYLHSSSFSNLGLCQIDLWELEEAKVTFEEVFSVRKDFSEYYIEPITSIFCLAFLNSCLGYQEEAIYLTNKFHTKFSKKQLSSWARGYGYLFMGMTYTNLGNNDKSFEMYYGALSYAEESHYLQVKAKALTGLAELYREQRKFKAALSHHADSIELLDKIGAKGDLAGAYYQLGLTYQKIDETEKSLDNFEKAIQLFTEMEAPKQVERVQRSMVGEE